MAQEERGPAAIKNGTAVAVGILRHINAPDTAEGLVVAQRTVADAELGRPINALAREGAADEEALADAVPPLPRARPNGFAGEREKRR